MLCRRAILMLLIVGLVSPAWALADDDKKPVDLEIWAIHATTKNKDVAPELRDIAKKLQEQFKYTGFKLDKKHRGRAELNKSFSADLGDGYKATITPKSRSEKRIQLQVVVTRKVDKETKTVLKSTVTVDSGPFQPFGCGSMTSGDYLVIAVRAR